MFEKVRDPGSFVESLNVPLQDRRFDAFSSHAPSIVFCILFDEVDIVPYRDYHEAVIEKNKVRVAELKQSSDMRQAELEAETVRL